MFQSQHEKQLFCVENKKLQRKKKYETLGRMAEVMLPSSGSIPDSYFSISTLGSCQHQPRVRHIIPQIHVGATAQDLAPLLQWDVGFYGNCVGTDDGPARSSLALDFSTLCIPDGNKHNTSKAEVNNLQCSKPSASTCCCVCRERPYLGSHLAKELLESFPQLP